MCGKIILDLCGGTGSWSNPYKAAGYDVRLITLPDNDVFDYTPPENVYGVLAAPTCTDFSLARTNAKTERDLEKAMKLVKRCLDIIWQVQYTLPSKHSVRTSLKFWALENPSGLLQYFLGRPAFVFSPCDFGDVYTKKTHLWGNFTLPQKNFMQPIPVTKTVEYYAPPLPDGYIYNPGCGLTLKQVRRSVTPPGFAKAFFAANR